MILAIDIGNSNIVIGLFDKQALVSQYRVQTEKQKNEIHYAKTFSELIDKDLTKRIHGVIVGSVVPEIDDVIYKVINKQLKLAPLFASSELKTNIKNLTQKPSELGADRLADTVAAIELSRENKIVVDLGTATKFEVISADDNYLGGAIAPGIGSSFTSLISNASMLSDIKLSRPKKTVGGWSTKEHLDSGFILGFAGLVDGMTERIMEEKKWKNANVIVTGGYSDLITKHIRYPHVTNKNLILEGLYLLWKLNNT